MTRALWGEVGVGALRPRPGTPPAGALAQQDLADLAAAHPDALGLSALGQGVQGPARRRLRLGGASSPSPPCCSRPGGSEPARAMIRPRSCSVRRRGAPGRGRSPSPSSPWALKRCNHLETVLGWQPNDAATSGTVAPSQLPVTMRARWIQLAGACRLAASLRSRRSSAGSVGGRAYSGGVAMGSPSCAADTSNTKEATRSYRI